VTIGGGPVLERGKKSGQKRKGAQKTWATKNAHFGRGNDAIVRKGVPGPWTEFSKKRRLTTKRPKGGRSFREVIVKGANKLWKQKRKTRAIKPRP